MTLSMSKPFNFPAGHETIDTRGSIEATPAFATFAAGLSHKVSVVGAALIALHPRGWPQLAQTFGAVDGVVRAYSAGAWREDVLTFAALRAGKAVRLSEVEAAASNDFVRQINQLTAAKFAVAVPAQSLLFEGFAGVAQFYRTAEQGEFTDADVAALSQAFHEFVGQVQRARRARGGVAAEADASQIAFFDSGGKVVVGDAFVKSLDADVQTEVAAQVADYSSEESVEGRRISVASSTGELTPFRLMTLGAVPALGAGLFVSMTRVPARSEWLAVRAGDFVADTEVARLIPAVRFMDEHFGTGPTLDEIARSVHLSPFHFHRRFSELMGITPKHYLLDCQIDRAKALLVERKTELTEIARVCGFAHQSHFTSRFKQATGLTPTRWRRVATNEA